MTEAERQAHYARMEALTRAHFEKHPECRKAIIGMDDAGNVIRDPQREIDVEARCGPGWFTADMWKGGGDRPVEAEIAEPEGLPMWKLRDREKVQPITRVMSGDYLPALRRAHVQGDLNRYNSYKPKPRWQRMYHANRGLLR